MPQEFYTGALIAVIAVIAICVLFASHYLGVKNYAPTALRIYQLYFISGAFGWLFFGLIEFAHLSISLSWLAIAYFCAGSLLIFVITEKVTINSLTFPWIVSNLVFILLEIYIDTLMIQIWVFIVYVLLHMGALSFIGIRFIRNRRNVGFNIIVLGAIIPFLFGLSQAYLYLEQSNVENVIGLGISGAAISYSLICLGFMVMMLQKERDSLASQAQKDALTGLYNRRGLESILEHLIAITQRESTHLSVIVCDIDYFKKVNDIYGHDVGDIVLQKFSKILNKMRRDSDLVARLGGEEFILVLPKTGVDGALILAERIRMRVEEMKIVIPEDTVKLTASFGVACQQKKIHIDELIKAADKALYDAKSSGRNQVCVGKID